MMDIHQLEKLRQQGKLESISATCHHLDFFNSVGVSAHYKISKPSTPGSTRELRQLIHSAVADVIRSHPILSAISVHEETPNPYFARLPSIDLQKSIIFARRVKFFKPGSETETSGEDEELDALLEKQHNTNFKSEYGTLPFWRLIILLNQVAENKAATGQDGDADAKIQENEFMACFIFHHAIGDGLSGLNFHHSFRDALDVASSASHLVAENIIQTTNKPLLPPIEDLHPLPINPIPPPPNATKEWTANPISAPCRTRYRSLIISPKSSFAFAKACKKNNVTVTSALPPLVTAMLFDILPFTIETLNCIIPVNLRRWVPRDIVDGAIGNWFDAFQIRLFRPDQLSENLTNIWPQAQKVSKDIENYFNAAPDGGPYTSIGVFKSIPDVAAVFKSLLGSARDSAIEVSNLGIFADPMDQNRLWQVGKVTLSRSAVIAGAAISICVVLGGDGSMSLGFVWQEGIVDEIVVDRVVDGVRTYFEEL